MRKALRIVRRVFVGLLALAVVTVSALYVWSTWRLRRHYDVAVTAVAIPTDALYSLIADPFNLHAVGKVFVAKGREPHRSLPLLVSDTMMAEDLVKDPPARFFVLARHFWPGPLTMIVPASAKVPLT